MGVGRVNVRLARPVIIRIKKKMEFNTNTILLFLAGMIFGGYVYIRAENYSMNKYYPDVEGEERIAALKKTGFKLTFIGVFLFVIVFLVTKNALLSGACAGFAIFGIKP